MVRWSQGWDSCCLGLWKENGDSVYKSLKKVEKRFKGPKKVTQMIKQRNQEITRRIAGTQTYPVWPQDQVLEFDSVREEEIKSEMFVNCMEGSLTYQFESGNCSVYLWTCRKQWKPEPWLCRLFQILKLHCNIQFVWSRNCPFLLWSPRLNYSWMGSMVRLLDMVAKCCMIVHLSSSPSLIRKRSLYHPPQQWWCTLWPGKFCSL